MSAVSLYDEHASRMHARIDCVEGQWLLRDLDTLNGTYVNGERIAQALPLQNEQVIGIADVRLQFTVVESGLITPPRRGQDLDSLRPGVDDRTGLWADDLAVLYDFMNAAVQIAEADALIAHTLEIIARRVRSTVCGYLSLDPERPLSKRVYPAQAEVDAELSRQLTRRVQGTGRAAWLNGPDSALAASDSLASYGDALCVPFQVGADILGALHVYKKHGALSQHEVRFCEVVAGFSANSLARLRLCRSLLAENSRLRRQFSLSDDLVGDSVAMQHLRQLIARAAPSNATVLIRGETGVGKELVALALHRQSGRCHGPFVAANSPAFSEALFESEFFGHVAGAFTGATSSRIGLFQQADDGTLFLDEVGDLSVEVQAKLLRAIESKSVRPVGSDHEVGTDVRVLAASNRDLEQEITRPAFRRDLYFRLGVVQIAVPPLREHAEDIPALVEHFLGILAGAPDRAKKLAAAALHRLCEYHWPGNVRQLRTVLENAAIMGEGNIIQSGDLYLANLPLASNPTLADTEKQALSRALDKAGGNISRAAKALGIGRDTLARKIKQYALDRSN